VNSEILTPEQQGLYLQDAAIGTAICLRLPIFEGPMDLLLYLIRREEVDVFNIPIALITKEYLRTLELMRACDLDVGGEFLSMAATLLAIKARMLLPRPVRLEDGVEEDPRLELVERLLEYKSFKETAEVLRSWEAAQADRFWRATPAIPDEPTATDFLQDVNLFDLLVAFKHAVDRWQAQKPHFNITLYPETVDQRIIFIREKLRGGQKLSFSTLIQELQSRLAVIITFLALLELVRIGEIMLKGVSDEDFFLQSRPAAS
jgi:segregation and condensation protein A